MRNYLDFATKEELVEINKKRQEVQRREDLRVVIGMLEGDTDRKKIANYIREYLLKYEK